MDSEKPAGQRLAFGAALFFRALLLAALVLLAAGLFLRGGYPATATMVTLLGVVAAANLFRCAMRADRAFAQAVDGIAAGTLSKLPNSRPAEIAAAIERARTQLARERSQSRNRPEYFQALCDNIPVALFAVDERERWQPINRSAWQLVGPDGTAAVTRQLGKEAVELLQAQAPGRQTIFRMPATGLRVLANTARWTAGGESQTLVALVPVDHLLDRVEMQAWQDLARILAHEMMNSLTPITSLAASARPLLGQLSTAPDPQPLTAELNAALETIERRSTGLLRFVENYRSVSDMPAAALQPVDVDELVERTLLLVSAECQAAGIALGFRRGAGALRIHADPALVEQALINLLKNAREAVAGTSEAVIEVRTGESGGYASIAVRDTGSGIDPLLATRVFLPFYTTKQGGSGIGLTLTRQIVLAHGGRIEIAPAPGRGTVVTMWLPSQKKPDQP